MVKTLVTGNYTDNKGTFQEPKDTKNTKQFKSEANTSKILSHNLQITLQFFKVKTPNYLFTGRNKKIYFASLIIMYFFLFLSYTDSAHGCDY